MTQKYHVTVESAIKQEDISSGGKYRAKWNSRGKMGQNKKAAAELGDLIPW